MDRTDFEENCLKLLRKIIEFIEKSDGDALGTIERNNDGYFCFTVQDRQRPLVLLYCEAKIGFGFLVELKVSPSRRINIDGTHFTDMERINIYGDFLLNNVEGRELVDLLFKIQDKREEELANLRKDSLIELLGVLEEVKDG